MHLLNLLFKALHTFLNQFMILIILEFLPFKTNLYYTHTYLYFIRRKKTNSKSKKTYKSTAEIQEEENSYDSSQI